MSDNGSGRDEHGRFAAGNSFGPGRPRRAIERDYLMSIVATVTLDDWRAICDRAKQDALNGDCKAREWLTHFLVGDDRVSLLQLAALEHLGIDADREVAGLADLIANPDLFHIGPEATPIDRALNLIDQERSEAADRLERQAKEKRKAERAAQKAGIANG